MTKPDTIVSAPLDPTAQLASHSLADRLRLLWRREGVVACFAYDYRREMIAEASAQRVKK
jgi:hypothetical protein